MSFNIKTTNNSRAKEKAYIYYDQNNGSSLWL